MRKRHNLGINGVFQFGEILASKSNQHCRTYYEDDDAEKNASGKSHCCCWRDSGATPNRQVVEGEGELPNP